MTHRHISAAVILTALSTLGFGCALSRQAGASGPDRDITFSDSDKTTALDCKGGAITVTGSDNTLTLNGECRRLTLSGDDNTITAKVVTDIAVSGDDNTIHVDTVGKIQIDGDDNTVRWARGVGNRPPAISNTGDDNTTKQGGK